MFTLAEYVGTGVGAILWRAGATWVESRAAIKKLVERKREMKPNAMNQLAKTAGRQLLASESLRTAHLSRLR
jgi:hypothetical protein